MTMDRPDVTQALSVPQAMPTGEELWSLRVVMAKTGLSRSTLYTYVAAGAFPAQRRLGPRRVAWLASEVDAWITSRPRSPEN
jgi:prophage regulatory protein